MADAAGQATRTDPAVIGAERWAWPSPWIEYPGWAQSTVTRGLEAGHLFKLGLGGQSAWLDHLTRKYIVDGSLSRMVAVGIRGVVVNTEILTRALELSPEYAEQLSYLLWTGCTMEEAYWELAATDVQAACAILQPIYEASQRKDGLVSVEVPPGRGRQTPSATAAARRLHDRIDRPNLLLGIPATPRDIPVLQTMVASGFNTNATSIFSIDRYAGVVDAYIAGLETLVCRGGDPAAVRGVASFSIGRIDAEVDRRLTRLGTGDARGLHGRAGVAQASRAYRLFEEQFSSERWAPLARLGASPQRLLWTSSEADVEADHGRRYLEDLVAPATIHVLSESTALSLARNGIGNRAHDVGIPEAEALVSTLRALGIDLADVGLALENQTAALTLLSATGLGRPSAQ
jgi:transaldolase